MCLCFEATLERPIQSLYGNNFSPSLLQDEFSVQSHRRAAQARSNGTYFNEIVPVQMKDGTTVTADDGIRW